MNEIKRTIIFGSILLVLFGLLIGIYVFDKKEDKTYTTTSNKSNYQLYYLGREGCGFCTKFQPHIDYIKETYGIDYTYIDISKISNSELNEYLTKFNIGEDDKFGTPTIAIMNGDNFVAKNIGYIEKQELFYFLKKNNMITEKYTNKNYPNLNYIELEDYKKIVESNDKQFVVISQDGCKDCDKTQEYLNKLAKEYGLKVNYYDVYFETQDDYNVFYNSYDYIKEQLDNQNLYTPTFLVVENKKVIDSLAKFESEEKLLEFLKKNNLIK